MDSEDRTKINVKKSQAPVEDFSHVSIFSDPVLSIKTLGRVSVTAFKYAKDFVDAHQHPITVALIAIFTFIYLPLPTSIDNVSS